MGFPPSRLRHRWLKATIVAAVAVTLTGCGSTRFSAPEPVTGQGKDILNLWQGSVIAALGVGALVWFLIIYSLVRFRRRNDELPGQAPYNVPIEVVYTVVPLVVVAVLFAFTMRTERGVTAIVDEPDLVVDVIGFQWQWQFVYPDEGITVTGEPDEPATLVLPVGRTVRLRLESPDVVHSFWVPRFLSKRDLIPGVRNEIDVDVDEPGTWVGRCAEFCGLDHYRMNFSVRAVPVREFDRWVETQAAEQADPGGPGDRGPQP